MVKIFSRLFLLLGCMISFQTSYALSIDKIVLFGDSLSDNGNLFAISYAAHQYISLVPIVPKEPYYKGRFSNGPVWDEVLADKMKIDLANYAYGGAWVESTWDSGQVVPFDLNTQVNFYLVNASKDFNKEQHLYVIFAGGNDYSAGRKDPDYATSNTVAIIQKQIDWLIYYGAKNFMLATLPDLGRVPKVVAQGPEAAAGITKLIELHNQKIREMVAEEQKKHPDLVFLVMDMREPFNDLIDHPEKYNLKNTKEGCYTGDYSLLTRLANPSQLKAAKEVAKIDIMSNDSLRTAYLTSLMAEKGIESCDNPDEYFFWDQIHPTRVIHQVMATITQVFLAENGIVPVEKKP